MIIGPPPIPDTSVLTSMPELVIESGPVGEEGSVSSSVMIIGPPPIPDTCVLTSMPELVIESGPVGEEGSVSSLAETITAQDCPSCGQAITADMSGRFCPYCGAEI